MKKYVEEHEGKVEVFSKEKTETSTDHGTEFILQFKSVA